MSLDSVNHLLTDVKLLTIGNVASYLKGQCRLIIPNVSIGAATRLRLMVQAFSRDCVIIGKVRRSIVVPPL